MRLLVWGVVIAVAIYLISGGHLLFLPLLFFIPLGGGLFGRRRSGGGLLGGPRYSSRRW